LSEQIALIEATVVTHEAADDVLERLVREYSRLLFKIAYSVVRNYGEAEDAVQETFLRVVRHRGELRDVQDERAWLARICWRIAVDRRRSDPTGMHQDGAEDLQELRSGSAGAERTAISRQMLQIAQRLIANLPDELRDVLTLSAVDEMNSSAIASILGIPDSSVRTRLFRARQLLKDKLAAVLEGRKL
jgi:RNA polymerase sigma-70 factor (ECF subfamily)